MRIAVLQLNFLVGDLSGNTQKILDAYAEAIYADNPADIVVTSELAIFGYPPKDLLLKPEYLRLQNKCLEKIKKIVGSRPLILGIAEQFNVTGPSLYNTAVVIQSGEIIHWARKVLLPNYDVFDEKRYFSAGPPYGPSVFELEGKKIGLLICEDIWAGGTENPFGGKLYAQNPVSWMEQQDPDILIVINASPYYWKKGVVRFNLVSSIAKKLGCSVVYANQVGGHDDIIFDGRSFVCNTNGTGICARPFVEDILFFDTEQKGMKGFGYHFDTYISELYKALVMGTRDYAKKSGLNKAVIGLSGGIDSALTAAIAVDALGAGNVTGITMPSKYSSVESMADSYKLAHNLRIAIYTVPIKDLYQQAGTTLKPVIDWFEAGKRPGDVTEENIQARLRGLILMAYSNRHGALVLTTGNKSEIAMGYCTLYGDMVGGFGVLSDVFKTDVYKLARYRNSISEVIPEKTISKPPSAELRPGQKDTDSLPPYDVLDPILRAYIEENTAAEEIIKRFKKIPGKTVRQIIGKVDRSEYKRRQMPPGVKVSKTAFGTGRRMPIAAKFI